MRRVVSFLDFFRTSLSSAYDVIDAFLRSRISPALLLFSAIVEFISEPNKNQSRGPGFPLAMESEPAPLFFKTRMTSRLLHSVFVEKPISRLVDCLSFSLNRLVCNKHEGVSSSANIISARRRIVLHYNRSRAAVKTDEFSEKCGKRRQQ